MIHAKDLVEVVNQTQPRNYVHLIHEPTGLEAKCSYFKDRSRNKAMCVAMIESWIYSLDTNSCHVNQEKEYYGY